MDTVLIEKLQYLEIGTQGENDAEIVRIDMSNWVDELSDRYPNLCFHLLFKPYNSAEASVMLTTYNSDTHILTWEITLDATMVAGVGYVEIRALNHPDTGLLKKSRVIPTLVNESISGVEGGTVPSPYQDWVNSVLEIKDELNNVFGGAVTTYQNSLVGTTPPSGTWTSMPNPQKGYFLWSKLVYTWDTGSTTTTYTVSYIGDDTEGAVTSVNGMTGGVSLDGGDIPLDGSAQTPVTLAAKAAALDTAISALDSAKLDASKIVYSATAPTGSTGMIWLKPKS